jgi:protein transport protein SEC24
VFTTSLSSIGIGKVGQRLNPDLYNKPEEATKMMQPAHDYFSELAAKCINERVCVDLYMAVSAVNQSVDLTTIAPVCGKSGGSIYFYQNFDVTRHGEKIYYDMFRSLTRVTATDVELKVRCSTGLTITEYIGGQMSA